MKAVGYALAEAFGVLVLVAFCVFLMVKLVAHVIVDAIFWLLRGGRKG